MNEAQIIEAIRSYWLSDWEGDHTVLWDDDEPEGPIGEYSLRVMIRSAGTSRAIIGRSREDNRGTVTVELKGPRSDGPGQLERMASQVADLWRAFRHERIRLDAPSVIGLPAEGAFNRQLVTLGWRGDMRF